MNTMADNIGGNAARSFGKMQLKARRGIDVSVGGGKENAGVCGEDGDWRELRFIPHRRNRSCGRRAHGELEANVIEWVPSTKAVVAGLRSNGATVVRAQLPSQE